MRVTLKDSPVDVRVAIGEGEIDEAPMLYIGEKLGTKIKDDKILFRHSSRSTGVHKKLCK